tara:strand:- start:172 stop:363 length:192 start_codon:yes stop_codon:yes gene_type:complete
MKNNLGFVGFLLLALMFFALTAVVSNKISATTPIDPSNKPNPPENDPCWVVETPCLDEHRRSN